MRKIISVFLLVLLPLSGRAQGPAQKEEPSSSKVININYHKTIETIMILRAINPDDYFLKRVPDSSWRRPMIYKARRYFAAYKNHPAVGETQRMLDTLKDIGGALFQGVLYAEDLPGTAFKCEVQPPYWNEHKEDLAKYIKILASFYKDANVEGFFKENEAFYNGAIAEARKYINDSVICAMEGYFGKTNEQYNIYLLPMSPYGWGFCLTTPGKKGNVLHAVISPVENIAWDENAKTHTTYGFGGPKAKDHYNTLVVHEFVHAFITNVIQNDSFKNHIAQYDSLYTPLLDSLLGEIGYSGWWSYVNEHLVRLGHARVAESISKKEAEELRNIEDSGNDRFVFLPEAEELARTYEQNRKAYKTFDDFLPQLIDQFGKFSRKEMDKRLLEEAKR